MIIQIRDDLFDKVVEIMKHRNLSIYNELKEIKPLDTVATDRTLQQARELKTQKVKQFAPADLFGQVAGVIRTVLK